MQLYISHHGHRRYIHLLSRFTRGTQSSLPITAAMASSDKIDMPTVEMAPPDAEKGGLEIRSVGHLHRRLNNRQVQLIAAGGSIGTALFISIGSGLAKGGQGNLVIAFTLYSCILALVNNSMAEMVTHMPVAGGFVRLAGHWVDDALGFLAGWNFFLYEALMIPFEISALTSVVSFWNDDVTNPGPTAGVCAAVIACYMYAARP